MKLYHGYAATFAMLLALAFGKMLNNEDWTVWATAAVGWLMAALHCYDNDL